MNKICISENKTLKLENVISHQVDLTNYDAKLIDTEVSKMKTYIEVNGAKQIGPLIQFSKISLSHEGKTEIIMKFMMQSNRGIESRYSQYKMDSIYRVTNCLYARFNGPEEKIKFGYDKLCVYAFENDIDLEGSSYTVYLDKNEETDIIIADIFMPIVGV